MSLIHAAIGRTRFCSSGNSVKVLRNELKIAVDLRYTGRDVHHPRNVGDCHLCYKKPLGAT